jgi:hypothetical protein
MIIGPGKYGPEYDDLVYANTFSNSAYCVAAAVVPVLVNRGNAESVPPSSLAFAA